MRLQEIFPPEFIKVDIDAEDKYEAFEEMVSFFCEVDGINAHDEILNAIVARETKMSTGIHKGIAVPHGKVKAVSDVCGVLGISRKGVQYDSLDGEPVNLIFMIIAPVEEASYQKYLKVLKYISELMEIPQFQDDLQEQTDPQNAFKVICNYDELLS